MPQIVEVEGVGEIEFDDTMTPDQIRSAIETDILPKFQQPKVIQAVPVEPEPTTDNLFGRLGASISENASLAVQGLGQMGRYSPNILIGQGIANLIGAGDVGPRRNLERAIGFAGDVQAQSRPSYDVTTPADTLTEQVVEGIGSLPAVVAAGPAAPVINAAIMGESQRQEAEEAGASPLTQAASFAGAAGVGALSEFTLGIPAMLRGGGGRRILDNALLGLAREGTQEAVDTAGQNVVAATLYDPNRDLTQGVKESATVGGIIGGPLGPLMQGAREGAAVTDTPDLAPVAAALEEVDEVDLSRFGSQARETAPEEVVAPPITLAQQASANLLGTDATELRQQEAIVTGQPVVIPPEEVTEEVVEPETLPEPAPEEAAEVTPEPVADEIVAEEGADTTPVPEGLVRLEPDTFERLADEPVQEGFVALQDPETNDVFQVPVNATPEQVQEARTQAREQSQMAELQFLREENARKFEEARAEQDALQSLLGKDPVLRKNVTSGEAVREIWDVPSNLKFQLERQEVNLKRAQAGTLKDADGKPVPPAALEKGVQMLRDRYEELTAKVAPAKKAVKGMKRGKKTEGSTQIPQAIVELGESLYRQGVEFKDWSRAMLRNLGEKVRPVLKQIWDGIVGSVNALSPAQRRRIEGRMQRSAPSPEGGAVGSQGGRRAPAEPAPAPEPQEPVGIANAEVARGRERIGLGPRFAPARRTFGEVWNQAMDLVGQDPAIASDLVADLTNNPRPVTDTEVALLVYERIVRENRYDQAVATTNTAATEAEVLSGQESITRAQQGLDQLYKVTEGVGTATARALNARKLLANRDLSLARMRAETQAIENNGQPLTPEQEKRIADLYAENKRLRDALEKLEEDQAKVAANQTFAAMMKEFKSERKEAVKTGKTVTDFLNEQADKARERLRSKMSRTSAGVDPTILVDVAIIGASHIANGISTAAEFSARIIQEFGEDLLPHMPEIFQQAQELHASNTEAFGAKTATQTPSELTPADILKEATPELDPRLVFELARAYVRQGMTGMEQVMDRIHQDLLPIIPELTLREVRDAFSGYGKVTYPSKAEDLVKLREMRVLARLTSQLEDVQRRMVPLRTGPQRDKMTIEARVLQTQISNLMRKYDLSSADPLQQLKTSREAVKTRLRNEIEELEQAITTRTPRPANRTPVEYDAETKALQARRDQVRSRYEELFPRASMTPEQRIVVTMKALDKAIAEESQMLRDGILQRPPKAPGVSTPAIENKQMELDALRQLRRELFAATQPRKAPEDIALEQAMKAAQASIDRMDQMLKTGNLDPAKRNPRFTPTNELEALWSERDAMRDALAELRRAQKPRTDPEERARKQTVKMLEKSIKDLDRRITTGDFSTTPRKVTRPDVKEVSDLRDLRDQMRKTFNDLKKAQTPTRSPEEIALSRDKKNIRNRIAKLQEKIANNDYAPAPKKVPAMDREKRQLQFDYQMVREVYLEGLLKAQLRNRTLPKKIFGTAAEALNTSRAVLTSADFSGVLRQGGFIAFGNPVRAAKSLPAMFKAFASEKAANDVKEEIRERPNYQNGVYQQAKLYLADDAPASLSSMEEAYMSRWANKIPLVAGSQRAYVTFLNKLRADSFDAMAATLALNGNPTLEESRVIANFVNVATGRGDLGKLAGAGVALNTVFFAPRYVLSRFQILAGQPFYGGNARTRKMIAKEYAKYLIGVGVVTALLAAGADDEDAPLETDSRSSDFLKVRMGNTRLDPFSGLLQITTLVSRIYSGEIKSKNRIVPIRGEKIPYGSPDTSDIMFRFVRTKFSPVFGTMWDIATGKNVVGDPVTPKEAALKGMVPISIAETAETMQEQGIPRGTALMLLSMFGVGLQTYQEKAKASKLTTTDFGPTMK